MTKPPPVITIGIDHENGGFLAGYGVDVSGATPDAAVENLLAFLEAHGLPLPEDYGVINLYHKDRVLSTEDLSV